MHVNCADFVYNKAIGIVPFGFIKSLDLPLGYFYG